MDFLRSLGIGRQKIISQNNRVQGVVTAAETCWWLKVNKSAFRTHPLEGAAFPHMIRFRYRVDGTEYSGGWLFDAFTRCPLVNEVIDVYIDRDNPKKYAVVGDSQVL